MNEQDRPNSDDDPQHDSSHSTPQQKIGEFEIERVIGRGGMGVVYLARQPSLQRHVALKVLPYGHAIDPITRQRFQLEARVAAGLEHPNIVPVFSVGADAGVDYFAMQYIDGFTASQWIAREQEFSHSQLTADVSPDTYVDAQRQNFLPSPDETTPYGKAIPPSSDRYLKMMSTGSSDDKIARSTPRTVLQPQDVARIGIAIADALAAAHRKGIIHRDVKPSNLIIDGTGRAYLSDFGLAHVEQDQQLTSPGAVVGSLRYMAPEQLDSGHEAVDPRCDVYGLGATLFEMLTLQPLIQGKNRREIMHSILYGERRSARGSNPAIPRDLSWIVSKATARDRRERYGSAMEMAEDLSAFLEHRPISARPSSPPRRLIQLAQRNPGFATSGLLLFVALAGATIASTVVARRMSLLAQDRADALQTAEQETRNAVAAQRKAESMSDLLLSAFRSPDPAIDGRKYTVAQMLKRSKEQVLVDSTIDDVTRGEMLDAIGQSLRGLGDFEGAFQVHQACWELRKRVLGDTDVLTLQSQSRLALAYRDLSQLPDSIRLYEEALKSLRHHHGTSNRVTMETMGALAMAYQDDLQLAKAFPLHEESLQLRQEQLPPEDPAIFQAMNNMALWMQESNRHQEAYELHRKAYESRLRVLTERHPDTLQSMANLVGAMQDLGMLQEALPLQERALQLHRDVLGENHPNTLINMNNTALLYSDLGRHEECIRLFEEVLEKMRSKLGDDHQDTLIAMGNLAFFYQDAERLEDAIRLGTERYERELAEHGPDHLVIATCRSLLGTCLTKQYSNALTDSTKSNSAADSKILKEAESHLRDAMRIREAQQSDSWSLGREQSKLGEVLLLQGRASEAEPFLKAGWELLNRQQEQIPAHSRADILKDAEKRLQSWNLQQTENTAPPPQP
jgi:serine/threonine protein kinase/tetratricopeptide (TPR) repeat protein